MLPLSSPSQSLDLTLPCISFFFAYYISIILNKSILLYFYMLQVDEIRCYITQLPSHVIVPFTHHLLGVSLLTKNDQLRVEHMDDMIDELTLQAYTDPHIREVTADALLADSGGVEGNKKANNGGGQGDAEGAEEMSCTGTALVSSIAPLLSTLWECPEVASVLNQSITQEYQALSIFASPAQIPPNTSYEVKQAAVMDLSGLIQILGLGGFSSQQVLMQVSLTLKFSIPLASYVMWSGALDSSRVLQSYSIVFLA